MGISIVAASSVYIEHLVISDFTGQAIIDQRSAGPTQLFILDTVVRNNGGTAILATSTSANAVTSLDNVRSEGNGYGLAIAQGNIGIVTRSLFSGNVNAGVEVDAGGSLNVSNSVISYNGRGVQNNNIARLFNNDISFNTTAFIIKSASSFGGNRVSGNTALGPVPVPVSPAAVDFIVP